MYSPPWYVKLISSLSPPGMAKINQPTYIVSPYSDGSNKSAQLATLVMAQIKQNNPVSPYISSLL